uniref:ANK_REP_REGION domain-containing protein n=1 Tax=Heterorhabditis bacteriophora TaxID=37862 RepID=A0A1I7W721_HETBA
MRLLHIAVLRERHEVVEFIATEFPQAINLLDQTGRSAIHYAAAQPNAIYDTLVDLGADTRILDVDGFSAEAFRRSPDRLRRPTSVESSLMVRSMSTDDEFYDPGLYRIGEKISDAPSEEAIEEWLSLGDVARLEQLVLDGRGHMLREKTTMNAASKEFLRGLNQYQSKIDAIHKAVEEGDVRRVKSLIDRQQLAVARDTYDFPNGYLRRFSFEAGRTPLHYAAADPNGEHMIKVLQKSGGDAFIDDKHGHTPFYYRTHGQRLNVRSMKDNAVMNQLVSGQLNRTLLQGFINFVEDADSIGFLEVLPQYQAKIQAIHKAVETGNLRAVKLLTDRKKLTLCRDSRGLSPLHKAIVFDRSDIAKYLIRNYPHAVNAMDQVCTSNELI